MLITIAMAVHNIPEGLAISLVLVPARRDECAPPPGGGASSLPQAQLIAPLAYLFGGRFKAVLPAGLGFAGRRDDLDRFVGSWCPRGAEDAPERPLALAGGISFAVMLGAQLALFGV